jgi:hypothetical protein
MVLVRFPLMTMSLSQLLEESFQIAWEYLDRTGELGDDAAASRFLSDTIETMIRQGQRIRLALANRAIGGYQRFRSSGATGSKPAASVRLRPIHLPSKSRSTGIKKCQ